ncbi:hypothetical protein RHGRI_030090 [Rhododendron griersonianum]|uniref:Uncharacterized protein n=1 Tax=Rhododendron griersonianum TaxID=479676 RepID=A0AAV6IM87_9ERIC|nr:hypothetical protein RHGRI_030090 [Rhododendron griersonianum]
MSNHTGKWNYFFDGGGAKGLVEGITVGILGMAGSGGSVTFGSVGGRGGNAAGFGKVCWAVGSVSRVVAGNGGSAAGLGMVGIGGRAAGLGTLQQICLLAIRIGDIATNASPHFDVANSFHIRR